MSTRRAGGHYDETMQLYVDGELLPREAAKISTFIIGSATATGVREDPPLQPMYPPGRHTPVRRALSCPERGRVSRWSGAPAREKRGSGLARLLADRLRLVTTCHYVLARRN
jgi:hypothetical protein